MQATFFQKLGGEVIIENIPEEKTENLETLIYNFNKKSLESNPKDRVLSFEVVAKGMIRILTSREAVAKKLAKRIKQDHKTKISFIRCRQEAAYRVKLSF